MPDINIGALSEAINEKMDRDAQNVDTVSGADCVIEFQVPTADNNYTWYRKYKSGWVEQGQNNVVCAPRTAGTTFTYPITMAGAVNNVMAVINDSGDNYTMSVYVKSQTTTGFVGIAGYNGGSSGDRNINWQVSGMAQ